MESDYIPQASNPHGRNEELQWARIIGRGEPVKGMVVIFLQKMCAAFHEFEPGYHAGGLKENAFHFFQDRLSRRVQSVLTCMQNNHLDTLAGYQDLEVIKAAIQAATRLSDLAALGEPVHLANHTVTDALEMEQ